MRCSVLWSIESYAIHQPHGSSGPYPFLLFGSLLFGSLNEVPGVTACCSALFDWLPRSSGTEAQLASDCIKLPKSWESPVASENGGTSKFKSDGNRSMAEQMFSKCLGIYVL